MATRRRKKADRAEKIASWAYSRSKHPELHTTLAARIRRAIRDAVRAERERCIGLVDRNARTTGETPAYRRGWMECAECIARNMEHTP